MILMEEAHIGRNSAGKYRWVERAKESDRSFALSRSGNAQWLMLMPYLIIYTGVSPSKFPSQSPSERNLINPYQKGKIQRHNGM